MTQAEIESANEEDTYLQRERQKTFLPIIDNGDGKGMMNWAVCLIGGFQGMSIKVARISGSHADRAMNNAVGAFLETDCTDFLCIDADIIFTAEHVQKLMAHDAALVYGVYPLKEEMSRPCLGTLPELKHHEATGLTEVRWAGRGFMRVRREVFEAMKEENGGPALRYHNHGRPEWTFFASGPVQGEDALGVKDGEREWVSEDIMFGLRARKLGYPVLVDQSIVLMHEGSKVFTFSTQQAFSKESDIKTWRDIHGWFDYEDLYRQLVDEIPEGGTFVEVGSWLGKSIGAFCEFAKESGKNIDINAVDTFSGDPANEEHAAILRAYGGSVRPVFERNMEALGISSLVRVHAEDSVRVSRGFPDREFDAVFIDADHSYKAVMEDISAWYPKVKYGGIICGHDFDEEGVKRAVSEYFDDYHELVKTIGRCWFLRK